MEEFHDFFKIVADSLDTLDLACRGRRIMAGHKQMIQKTRKEKEIQTQPRQAD